MCLAGASRAGADVLGSLPLAELRLLYVWVPMLPADDMGTGGAAAERFAEPRALHYWDGERHLARHLARALGIGAAESLAAAHGVGSAWDVYLLFGRGQTELTRPAFWMHQLGVTHAPRLDAVEFRKQVEALLVSAGEDQA